MSVHRSCINPIFMKDDEVYSFLGQINKERVEAVNQLKPFELFVEITSRCLGACAYCYASSTTAEEYTIPKEKLLEAFKDVKDLGVKLIALGGGDPLLHPDWFELATWCAEQGMWLEIETSSIVSKEQAKKISTLEKSLWNMIIHIDSIEQETYNKVHTDPKTLSLKMQGYRNLLEAGVPPQKMCGCITMTKPVINTVEKTLDWFIDEMGASGMGLIVFKGEGFGSTHYDWEPSLSDIRRAHDYRAKKLGKEWYKIGSTDAGASYCRSLINLQYDGSVTPCVCTREFVYGNVYNESFKDIFNRNRDELLYNFQVTGYCGEECPQKDFCFGCRANAYHYTGDVKASDPRCPQNPHAKEYHGFHKA